MCYYHQEKTTTTTTKNKQKQKQTNKENTVLMIWSQYAKTAPFRLKLQVYSFVSGVDITSLIEYLPVQYLAWSQGYWVQVIKSYILLEI